MTRCGENVTLTCETTTPETEIILFEWRAKNISSQNVDRPNPKFLCDSTAKPPKCSVNLTLLNVMPVNQGEYLCKLHSKLGVESNKTGVTVQGEILFFSFFANSTVFFYLSKNTSCLQTALRSLSSPWTSLMLSAATAGFTPAASSTGTRKVLPHQFLTARRQRTSMAGSKSAAL